jgi:hypothetical protein
MIRTATRAVEHLSRTNPTIVNPTTDTDNDHVHNSLLERLKELTEVAKRTLTTPQGLDAPPALTHGIPSPLTSPTQIQPPLLPVPQITPAQRLLIAQTEWNKLLSQRNSQNTPLAARQQTLSAENQKENIPWGDSLGEKGSNVTRVYALNVNGLSIDRRGGRFDDLCRVTQEVKADILCCQEHNLDTTRSHVRSVLFDTARQHWSRSRIISATTPTPFVTTYKPGGTMMVSTGDTTGRIISQSQDKWGRWTSQTLQGTRNINLTVISAYQVVSDNPHTGLTTTTAQQQSLLIQSNDSCSPRKAFKRDLRLFLKERLSQGDELLLVRDFNEALGSEIDGMSQIAAELHLLNLMQTRHLHKPPATYARGKKCLDYGLATQRVANALLLCGYEAFNHRFATDHRAYYFDLDNEVLFGNMTQKLAPHSLRMLKSNNIEQVTQYLKLKYNYLMNRNVLRRSDQLSLPGNRHAFAERLDSDVLKASLDAEKNTKQFREPAWSVALSTARLQKVIFKKWLTMYHTGLDHSQILTRDMASCKIEMELPSSKQQCQQKLRETQGMIDKLVAESYHRRDHERDNASTNLIDLCSKRTKLMQHFFED